jgi:molecular chaperone GrpE (heat shock protein)
MERTCSSRFRREPTVSDEHDIPVKVVDRRWWARGEGAPVADEPARKPTYVEELERQLAEKDKAAQEYLAKYRAASQEFEGARARMRKEVAKDAERSRREVLVSLLVPATDPALDGRIVGLVRHGYRIGDEVLRPALVAVARAQLP